MMLMTMMIRGTFVGPSVLQTLKTVRTATKCHLQGETTFCLQISNQANIKDLIISSNKSSLRNFAKLQGPSPVPMHFAFYSDQRYSVTTTTLWCQCN